MKAFFTVRIKALLSCLLFTAMVQGQFRVIGYVHSSEQMPDLNKIAFQKLTHLNIAFVNPDSSGRLVLPYGLDSIVKAAHAASIKVLLSVGGGSHNPYYSYLLSDSLRGAFVKQFVSVVNTYNLDGIDVDLENDVIDDNYEKFVLDLYRQLKPLNKLLTAAVAAWNGEKISNAALAAFDFVNSMSYDETGPWAPQRPGQHSSYEKAVADLQYWTVARKLSRQKLNLGLPFYAYCFGTKYGDYFSFADIIKNFPCNENNDEIHPEGGGSIYYNGLLTIRKKVKLAMEKTGGVMVWQLMQDDTGKYSLLNAIDEQIHAGR